MVVCKREHELNWWFCYSYSQIKISRVCGMSCGDQRIQIQSLYELFPFQVWSIISRVTWLYSKLILVDCGIIGGDIYCFKGVSKSLCLKFGKS